MGVINDKRSSVRIEGICWGCEGKNGNGYVNLPVMKDKRTNQITRICEDAGGLKPLCDFCRKAGVSV